MCNYLFALPVAGCYSLSAEIGFACGDRSLESRSWEGLGLLHSRELFVKGFRFSQIYFTPFIGSAKGKISGLVRGAGLPPNAKVPLFFRVNTSTCPLTDKQVLAPSLLARGNEFATAVFVLQNLEVYSPS